MDFRLIELPETEVYGIGKPFDGQGYKTREELRHIMWAEECEDIPGQICKGRWNQPGNTSFDGIWYGIWQSGKYMIAREKADIQKQPLEMCRIPAGAYAAFNTECGGPAWEELPRLFELIFDSWLPGSEYELRESDIIEVYHLWTDHDMRKKHKYYEVWIPIKQK